MNSRGEQEWSRNARRCPELKSLRTIDEFIGGSEKSVLFSLTDPKPDRPRASRRRRRNGMFSYRFACASLCPCASSRVLPTSRKTGARSSPCCACDVPALQYRSQVNTNRGTASRSLRGRCSRASRNALRCLSTSNVLVLVSNACVFQLLSIDSGHDWWNDPTAVTFFLSRRLTASDVSADPRQHVPRVPGTDRDTDLRLATACRTICFENAISTFPSFSAYDDRIFRSQHHCDPIARRESATMHVSRTETTRVTSSLRHDCP